MVQGKYPTAFPLKHQQKDMRLALEVAQNKGVPLPVAGAANDMYVKVSPISAFHPGTTCCGHYSESTAW